MLANEDINEEEDMDPTMSGYELNTEGIPLVKVTQINRFMESIKHLFAHTYQELGECRISRHVINTVDARPIFCYPYRRSQFEREEIRKEV